MKDIKERLFKNKTIKNFYDLILIPEIRVLPGSLAFSLVMSIIPIVTLVAVICSKISLSTTDLTNFLAQYCHLE